MDNTCHKKSSKSTIFSKVTITKGQGGAKGHQADVACLFFNTDKTHNLRNWRIS